MKKTILAIVVLTVIIIGVSFLKERIPKTVNLEGCYVATISKDVYTLAINTVTGEDIEGTLSFNNFEKDSSSGDLSGMYRDGILLGLYSFTSEGMDSIMEVAFKKTNNGFIRGYGDVEEKNGVMMFTDINTLNWDTSTEFISSDCE